MARVISKLELLLHCDHETNGINLFRSNLNQSVSSSWLADRAESSSSSTASRLSAGCSTNCTNMSQLVLSVVLVVASRSVHYSMLFSSHSKICYFSRSTQFIYKYKYIRKICMSDKDRQIKGRPSQIMQDQNRSEQDQ